VLGVDSPPDLRAVPLDGVVSPGWDGSRRC
jgi:hypothetical protein